MGMLKEVGASGQIALGKRFAGQLFDVSVEPDNTIVLRPVQVVPDPAAVAQANAHWAQAHLADIQAYNAWAEGRETYAQRIRRWREASE